MNKKFEEELIFGLFGLLSTDFLFNFLTSCIQFNLRISDLLQQEIPIVLILIVTFKETKIFIVKNFIVL